MAVSFSKPSNETKPRPFSPNTRALSCGGVFGQPGQASYAAANTFLDAFALYHRASGPPCTVLDLGAVEGWGYLARNGELLRKMRETGWNLVREEQLLEVLEDAMVQSSSGAKATKQEQVGVMDVLAPITSENTILVGISPMKTADSGSRLSDDIRMTACLQRKKTTTKSASSDTLQVFLASANNNPAVCRQVGAGATVAREIGKRLFTLLLRPDDQPNIALTLSELGLDSLIVVEMRAWIKKALKLEIGALEMLAVGTLEELGRKVAGKLAEVRGV